MLEPVFTLSERGRSIYAPGGRLLEGGDVLAQPGLAAALEELAAEGADSVYRGALGLALLGVEGVALIRADLESYEPLWSAPAEAELAGCRFLTRGGLSDVPETLARLPRLAGLPATERVLALLAALGGTGPDGHTTNVTVVDSDGSACVLTTSLGLGTGDFLPGYDLHLNGMPGEVDLHHVPLVPGERMESMMAPSLAFDADGLALAIGSAGGTRCGRHSSASPPRFWTRGSERPRRCSARASIRSGSSCTLSPASTRTPSHSSKRTAGPSAAGRGSIITSAASASLGEAAPLGIRDGAGTRRRWRVLRERSRFDLS